MKKQKNYACNTLGDRLAYLRNLRGMNQSDFAKALGYSDNSPVSKMERDAQTPNTEVLMKISEVLSADLHWIITGKHAPSAQEVVSERQQAINKLARYISSEIARLLDHRDVLTWENEDWKEKQAAGEKVDSERVERLQLELAGVQFELERVLRDQEWVRLAVPGNVNPKE